MKAIRLEDITFIDCKHNISKIAFDSGMAYGLGFFETIQVTEKPHFAKAHTNRLNRSLACFGIEKYIEPDFMKQVIEHYGIQNCALRIQVSEKNVIVTVRPNPYTKETRKKGLDLSLSSVVKSSSSVFVQHKSCNFAENMVLLHEVKSKGFHDYLFQNENGYLTESCVANFFLIKNGELLTPPIEDGLLPGVVREFVIKHFPVRERHLRAEDLRQSEGAFLTNSLMGVKYIASFEGNALPQSSQVNAVTEHYFKHLM